MWKPLVTNVVFFLIVQFQNISGWRSFSIKFNNSSWTVYSNKMNINVTTSINNTLSMFFTVNEEVPIPMARVEIIMQSPDTGRYDGELLNRTIDTCKFFSNNLYEPLMQIIYGIMLEYGDFPKSCPLKLKTYRVDNMSVDPDRFPPYLPERKGYFKLVMLSKENNLLKVLTESTVFFEVKSSSLNRFKAARKN